ncbi:variant SH3 domain-containing protein [Plectosphaerella cucumerina]|uniref:Variant SH3 domain-containing protein n=1 Tax=Plectosphaerella cucumerina TaxID=40658 RepID=A0A8K0X4D4_9PEZI|nr:variant SH3 domain-containing protein [Plectosphaerella cucumerina]
MVPAPPPVPTRFPCWCRAVYSWGGESKRDLGFIEGDLIECLNAGDGSWWTGKLFRDRRTVGVFPSNFVEVLPENFRPTTRSVSPLPDNQSPSPSVPTKSKTFRKPFEAYAKAPHYTTAKQPVTYKDGTQVRPRENSNSSFQHEAPQARSRSPAPPPEHDYNARQPSPAPYQYGSYNSRAPSPAPHRHDPYASRAPSPAPPRHDHYSARAPSPAPPHHDPYASRAPISPAPSFDDRQFQAYRPGATERADSPPPPPPPPHRHVTVKPARQESNASFRLPQIERHGSTVSYNPSMDGLHTPRLPSPCPPSPGGSHMTPSPLREAMDGVMEQLDAIGRTNSKGAADAPLNPWSPECFDMVSHKVKSKNSQRPQTSMGLAQSDEGYETWSGESSQDPSYQNGHSGDPNAPQLSNYVERMESRLRTMQQSESGSDMPPPPPPKGLAYERPKSSMGNAPPSPDKKLRTRKSAYDVGRNVLGRTFTTKTNSTSASSGNQSSTTQSTNRSLMSGVSAGAISATSAGSLARKNHQRAQSAFGMRDLDTDRPDSPFTGVSYHSSHASDVQQQRPKSQAGLGDDVGSGLGGLVTPKAPKRSLFKKLFDSAKTGVATGRSNIATGTDSMKSSPFARSLPPGSPMSPGFGSPAHSTKDTARDMGLGNGVDWVQVRRDINRSNSLSKIERHEREERCQMLDHPALNPVDELCEGVDGDEGGNGHPVPEPIDYQSINLSQVDKNSRFIASLPPMTNSITLATTYVCRPYRSDVQRLRAIFTWTSERICWEEDFEGTIDTKRVIQTKRACAEEYALIVMEMCGAVGIQCEVVRGYLKTPGEIPDSNMMPRPNHWWNAVLIDNEWRMMDCCLASPSYPKRHMYSSAPSTTADFWWFLARPLELCWTHIPEHHEQQHICPPQAYEVLLNLPCANPAFFKNMVEMADYNTSLTRIEDLEMVHVKINVPADVEVAAEVEVRAYARDQDGDYFESGDTVKKRALAQAEWFNGIKRYTIKALLPGDEGQGVLKVYAGKRGLMHSIKDIPHPVAFTLPIIHTGENPPYEFVTRHPTPHAQRHDIYVVQPQCQRLALNNTFVFAVRQHPSSLSSGGPGSVMTPSSNPGGVSPVPFARPGSAMSMVATSVSGSNPSSSASGLTHKPAKLAIQTPGGKILRLMRKEDRKGISVGSRNSREEELGDGGTWETIIKCSEKGVWRGLVLADRTARWCVFAEWVCES